MERIVELRGLEGVYCSDVVHAYMSCNAEDVQKALEIGIPCTGANDYGAYNIYFDDYGRICFGRLWFIAPICRDILKKEIVDKISIEVNIKDK